MFVRHPDLYDADPFQCFFPSELMFCQIAVDCLIEADMRSIGAASDLIFQAVEQGHQVFLFQTAERKDLCIIHDPRDESVKFQLPACMMTVEGIG